MKLYTILTPSHQGLYDRFFLPSLNTAEFELHALELPQAGTGDFLNDDFKAAIRFKLEKIVESIRDNLGKVIVWSDVDIQFFDLSAAHIEASMADPSLDFAGQRLTSSGTRACGGFYAIRCSTKTCDFFEAVQEVTASRTNGNEQDAINLLLEEGRLNWQLLGPEYYARTHGLFIPWKAVMHHATCLLPGDSVRQKVEMLTGLEGFGSWSSLRKIAYYMRELAPALQRLLKLKTKYP